MVDMDFKQRASLLLHVAGFAIGVLVLPFAVFELFNYYDFGRGFEEASTLLLIGLISPIAGWILRWLISGEWSSFIPLVDDVFKPMVNALINALPKEGWSSSVLLLVIIGSPLVLYNLEKILIKSNGKVMSLVCNALIVREMRLCLIPLR
jgi:hypothetical protein